MAGLVPAIDAAPPPRRKTKRCRFSRQIPEKWKTTSPRGWPGQARPTRRTSWFSKLSMLAPLPCTSTPMEWPVRLGEVLAEAGLLNDAAGGIVHLNIRTVAGRRQWLFARDRYRRRGHRGQFRKRCGGDPGVIAAKGRPGDS